MKNLVIDRPEYVKPRAIEMERTYDGIRVEAGIAAVDFVEDGSIRIEASDALIHISDVGVVSFTTRYPVIQRANTVDGIEFEVQRDYTV